MSLRATTHTSAPAKAPSPLVTWAILAALTLVFLATVTMAVSIGSVSIPFTSVWQIIANELGLSPHTEHAIAQCNIIWQLRLPRVILAALVGAVLALVGAAIQALVRNPLADPYLLGVSSGASVGAASTIVLGLSFAGMYTMSFAAFLGALTATGLVFGVAAQRGEIAPLRLILSGTAIGAAFSALTSFIVFRAPDGDAARSVLFWLLGSFSSASWGVLCAPAGAAVVGTVLLVAHARALNALALGDEIATTLGVSARRTRIGLLIFLALMTGIVVAVSGAIIFVGLMVPHAVRMVVGPDHRRLLPVVAFVGAIFMIWVDLIARTFAAPEELPVGIVTALCGAPFFVYLLRTNKLVGNK